MYFISPSVPRSSGKMSVKQLIKNKRPNISESSTLSIHFVQGHSQMLEYFCQLYTLPPSPHEWGGISVSSDSQSFSHGNSCNVGCVNLEPFKN